jgi:hypothetical protein
MPPPLPTQLPLPLDTLPVLPPPSTHPCIQPKEVWRTVDARRQTQIRLTWARVLQEVADATH